MFLTFASQPPGLAAARDLLDGVASALTVVLDDYERWVMDPERQHIPCHWWAGCYLDFHDLVAAPPRPVHASLSEWCASRPGEILLLRWGGSLFRECGEEVWGWDGHRLSLLQTGECISFS